MHIHILGICGTFMGGVALLAREAGHSVTGSDTNVYPPMSTQLEQAGIELIEGYDTEQLQPSPDVIIVGNVLSRGNPAIEYILDHQLAFTSGPQWLAEHILHDRWVIGVAGTHGKTTTSSMIAWILEYAGFNPGFLIGGIPRNFGFSARLGDTDFFVVEADEYDTAFFDKRSKLVHYHPKTAVLTNLEFDHADIFDDLAMIKRQFHHFIRTIPGSGLIIAPMQDQNILDVLKMGYWTNQEFFGDSGNWQAQLIDDDASTFNVMLNGQNLAQINWQLMGLHNIENALAALAGTHHCGVSEEIGAEALSRFDNVKRRMELRSEINNIRLYDDFAHHPTAIESTLDGLRKQVKEKRIIAVLEPRSNSMRLGVHAQRLSKSLEKADLIYVYLPNSLDWNATEALAPLADKAQVFSTTQAIVNQLSQITKAGDQIIVMSNGGFEDIHRRIEDAIS